MKRVRRDASVQAKIMIEAWGEDKAREMVIQARNTDKSKGASDYWYSVLRQFPVKEVIPPPPPPFNAAMDFMRTHGIQGILRRDSHSKSGYVIEFDPCQDKFVAPSFIGRTDGSQPSEQGSTPCGATNSGPVV